MYIYMNPLLSLPRVVVVRPLRRSRPLPIRSRHRPSPLRSGYDLLPYSRSNLKIEERLAATGLGYGGIWWDMVGCSGM